MSLGTRAEFPVAGDGYQVEVKVKNQHLRLFAEVYALGYLAVVFDVNTKQEVAREDADNLDDTKKKAESLAAAYLYSRGVGRVTGCRMEAQRSEPQRDLILQLLEWTLCAGVEFIKLARNGVLIIMSSFERQKPNLED